MYVVPKSILIGGAGEKMSGVGGGVSRLHLLGTSVTQTLPLTCRCTAHGVHVRPVDEPSAGGALSVHVENSGCEHGDVWQASMSVQTSPEPTYPALHTPGQ